MYMKTIEEKLKICRGCKNRIEYHSGLTCTVTSTKPEFEDECPNYEPDEKEIARNKRQQEKEEANKTKVRGWLALFLWGGVFGGVILTAGQTLLQSENLLYGIVGLLPFTPMFIIAAMTITAFYRRKDNAVALAYTYIGMHALSAVLAAIVLIIASGMFSNSEIIDNVWDIFKSLVWAVTWGSFIKMSERVKNVIPEETRKWRVPEKILLIVYIFLLGGSIWLTSIGVKQASGVSEVSVESMIEQLKSESLPMEVSDGVILESVEKKDGRVVFSYSMSEIDKKVVSEEDMEAYFLQLKYSILNVLCQHPESEQLAVASLTIGDNVLYTYADKNGEAMGNILITCDDYKRVIGNKGEDIVEKIVLLELLDEYNRIIPCEYFGGTELMSVDLNYDEKNVVYNVRLPELSMDEMSAVTQSYLENYVLENWGAIEDSMITLAKINKMDIVFVFTSHYSGTDYAKVTITPEQYLQ